jgi:hypothetical protein
VATEKTWNDPDVNRPHFAASTSTADQVRGFLWYVKAWLTGQIGGATRGLWTVVGSSDGATAGMDGVDRWGAVYDGTKLIRAAAGTAHSWMVLRSPGITAGGLTNVPFYMIIEWSASDVAPTFYGCKALPTGGTITARPTSTDETLNFGPSQVTQAAGTPKLSALLASDGTFWFFFVMPGSGMIMSTLTFNVLADCRPTDLWPVCFGGAYGNAGAAAMGTAICGAFQTRRFDGSVAVAGCMTWEQGMVGGSTQDPAASTANTGDAADGSFITLLTHFYVSTAGQRSFKGRFQDTVVPVPGDTIAGDSFPPGGAPTDQVLWHIRIPIAGTPLTF